MFEGCLELCLDFIGVQPVDRGCSSAELSEFICEDLLPYQGWAANNTLRNTIVRLLLTSKADEFTLYTVKDTTARSNAEQRISSVNVRSGRRPCGSGRRGQARKAAPAVNFSTASEAADARKALTAEEVVEALDAGRVAWSTSNEKRSGVQAENVARSCPSLRSTSSLKKEQALLFFFVPSRELRGRVFGFPIRSERDDTVSRFIAENAIQGWELLPNTDEFKARFKIHLVGAGVKRLRQAHKVSLVYLFRKTTQEVFYRYFPHFALPLTERERTMQPQWMTVAGATSTQALFNSNDDSAATTSTTTEEADDDEGGCHPTSMLQRRLCRRYSPLDHYYARMRHADASFPRVVFDLQLIRQIIQQSPERRLLMQDTMHAILAAHQLSDMRWEDFSKTERGHLRMMMVNAGLRILAATLTVRGRRRNMKLVVPEEDVASWAETARRGGAPVAGQKRPRNDSGSDKDDSDASHSDGGGGGAGGDFGHYGLTLNAEAGMRDSALDDNDNNDEDDSDGDDAGEEQVKKEQEQQLQSPPITVRTSIRNRQIEAASVLRIDPGQFLELQAAHEAERRPLALTSLIPHIRFQLTINKRNKSLSAFMEKYMKLHGTFEMQHFPLRQLKSFMLVYAPRLPPPTSAKYAVKTEAASVVEDEEGAACISQEQQQLFLSAHGLSETAPTFFFTSNDPRVPKGVSPYAINLVLETLLQATPHHAASLRRLTEILDITALQRRVLPALRELNYVYTTGVTLRGKKRVGMVVLRTPQDGCRGEGHSTLDDAAKRAVLDAEEKLPLTVLPSAAPRAPAGGAAIPSALVLDSVPIMSQDFAPSKAATILLRAQTISTKGVNRVMAVRNGYARNVLLRVSRLHMELWGQHYLYLSDAAFEDGVRVCEMFDRMTLSTYCIVVGLPHADLAAVLDLGGGAAQNGKEGTNNDGGALNSYLWSTPIKLLPPSVYGWCSQHGLHMLCMCLTELQNRQLVRSTDNFQHLLYSKLQAEVRYALCSSVSVEGYTYNFTTTPPCTSSTLYACMRYWLPTWNTVRWQQHELETELVAAEPNPSILQIMALCKVVRRDAGVMAAQLYQNCGVPRELRRSNLSEMQQAVERNATGRDRRGRVTLTKYSPSLSLRLRAQQQDLSIGGDDTTETALTSRKRKSTDPTVHGDWPPHKAERTEISGRSVANALEYAFHHFSPLKRVEEVVRLVLRGRSLQLNYHILSCVPPILPAVLRHGADLNSALAGVSWTGNVYHTEFNVCHTGQGGGSYNRLLNPATLHMGILAETLRVLRLAQAGGRPFRLTGDHFSSTDSLKSQVESVYSPRVELPSASTTAASETAPLTLEPATTGEDAVVKNFPAVLPSLTSSNAVVTPQHTRLAAEFEVVTDILRMILFSDHIHYRASIARALLSALNADLLVTRARLFLQKMPAFGRTRRYNFRVPQLSVVRSPFLLPLGAMRGVSRPCATISVLHQWTHNVDDIGEALSSGRRRLHMFGKQAPLQVLLNGGSHLQTNSNNTSDANTIDTTIFPCPLQLLHQPTVDLADGNTAPNAVREHISKVPLPHLAWPKTAVECERKGWPTPQHYGVNEEQEKGEHEDVTLSQDETQVSAGSKGSSRKRWAGHLRRHYKRARASSSSTTTATTTMAGPEADAESDSEDERAVLLMEAETTRRLYPARLVRSLDDPVYLQDLPVDGPPTQSEQLAVERCRKILADGQCATLSTDDASSPYHITYPSIFHHVDGSFHQYMWQFVVHAVYRFLLRVPGISHADLECRLTASGILSQRAVRAVLRFLIDGQLLMCKEEELSDDRCVAGGGVVGPAPRVRGPFQFGSAARKNSEAGSAHTALASSSNEIASMEAEESSLNRRCYTAIAPLDVLQFAISAANW